MSYLLDTNVIAELLKANPNEKVQKWIVSVPDDSLYLSVLTLGEIRKGLEKVVDNNRKAKLKIWLEHQLPDWFGHRILFIDRDVADRWGRLQAEIQRSLPAIDSLIAATALHYDLCLVTRNMTDFDYPALEVINPWDYTLRD